MTAQDTCWMDCANQLVGIFTRLFNQTLSKVSPYLKFSIIVPPPKKQTINSINDHRPGVLTSVVMKCFKKLIRNHCMCFISLMLNPYQFPYTANTNKLLGQTASPSVSP